MIDNIWSDEFIKIAEMFDEIIKLLQVILRGENVWNEISSQEDVHNLLEIFGYFHDGCIKELKYVIGIFVRPNMNVMPINEKLELSVIFQRQWRDPSVIEIVFSGLSLLHLAPVDENYTSEILDANMEFSDYGVFWVDGSISEKNHIILYILKNIHG